MLSERRPHARAGAKEMLMSFGRMKGLKNVPLFPVIPLVPIALMVGSLVIAFRALAGVRRLERRMNAAPV